MKCRALFPLSALALSRELSRASSKVMSGQGLPSDERAGGAPASLLRAWVGECRHEAAVRGWRWCLVRWCPLTLTKLSRQLMSRTNFTQHINHSIGSELSGTAYERLFLIYSLLHTPDTGQLPVCVHFRCLCASIFGAGVPEWQGDGLGLRQPRASGSFVLGARSRGSLRAAAASCEVPVLAHGRSHPAVVRGW